ncbi:MAG: DsbE family thiol:disulfide interchange protein [Proteobacteria bacterium]|nr:DsbE family thiol:disulfide interchange protein [Pseudomonadota bacterium]
MKSRFIYLMPLLIFIGLFIVVFIRLQMPIDPHEIPTALLNQPIPQFEITLLNNEKQSLSTKDFMGHVSILNVWATWCVTCREDHELLMKLAKSEPLIIYGLNYKDSKQESLAWLARLGNPYRKVGFDQQGRVAIDWGVYGTPETFIIDKTGLIRYRHTGPLTESVWKKEIKPLIVELQA